MKIIEKIRAVLAEGPSTADEVAVELGMDEREVGNRLNDMKRRGSVIARPFYGSDREDRMTNRGRPPNLYSLVHY